MKSFLSNILPLTENRFVSPVNSNMVRRLFPCSFHKSSISVPYSGFLVSRRFWMTSTTSALLSLSLMEKRPWIFEKS